MHIATLGSWYLKKHVKAKSPLGDMTCTQYRVLSHPDVWTVLSLPLSSRTAQCHPRLRNPGFCIISFLCRGREAILYARELWSRSRGTPDL